MGVTSTLRGEVAPGKSRCFQRLADSLIQRLIDNSHSRGRVQVKATVIVAWKAWQSHLRGNKFEVELDIESQVMSLTLIKAPGCYYFGC